MKKVKLVDICKIQYGFAFDSSLFSNSNNGMPLIRIRDVVRGFTDTYTSEAFIEDYVVNKGDLLIGMDGEFNIAEWQSEKALLNQRVCKLIPSNTVGKRSIYYSLIKILKQIEEKTAFVTVKHLSAKELNKVEIPLPSLEEQKAIAEKLDKVSELIENRKAQLEKLNLLIKSRFIEMFGEIGTNIKGWGFKRLGDCCTINPKKGEDKRLHQELIVSFVPMPAVSEKGEIDPSEKKSYDEVKTGFTYFAEQDVLFAKITPCMENGKGAVAKGLCNGIGFGSTEFHVLRPIKGVSNPYWLYTVTAFKQFRMDAAGNMTGSAGQRRVPASFLDAYKVSLPPIELQHKFATFAEQVDKSKFEIQKSLEKLEILKKSLMQQYFG